MIEDCEQIRHLMEILEDREFPSDSFRQVFSEQLSHDRYVCLVYTEDEKIIGALNMRIEAQLHRQNKVAQIMELVVEPSYRCHGIGSALFQAAEQIAKEQGCEQIELETSSWRKRAHSFYERKGMICDHLYYRKPTE